MGAGSSSYNNRIEKQEAFVRQNLAKFKQELNNGKDRRNDHQYIYNDFQVQGKLRQLYHNSDAISENRRSYINHDEWKSTKSKLGYY